MTPHKINCANGCYRNSCNHGSKTYYYYSYGIKLQLCPASSFDIYIIFTLVITFTGLTSLFLLLVTGFVFLRKQRLFLWVLLMWFVWLFVSWLVLRSSDQFLGMTSFSLFSSDFCMGSKVQKTDAYQI